MSENRALVKLAVYRLAWRDLDHLTEDQKAAIGLLCFAANEVNALTRINLFQLHSSSGPTEIDSGYWIQRGVILRTWSSKLFEIVELIDDLASDRKSSTNDAGLKTLAKRMRVAFPESKSHPGFEIARDCRNELSFHYKLRPALKNIRHIREQSDASLLLHRMRGNTYYLLGEEVGFTGLLLRKSANYQSDEDRLRLFDDWISWNFMATDWLESVVLAFFQEFVFSVYPDRAAYERVYWIDPKLVADADQLVVPLFLRDTVP